MRQRPGGWLGGPVGTPRRVSTVDNQGAEALLPADALPRGEAAYSRMEPVISRPQQPLCPQQLWRAHTPILALAWLMENEQGVFLKAACSPLWGLLACLLEGKLQLGSLGIPGS